MKHCGAALLLLLFSLLLSTPLSAQGFKSQSAHVIGTIQSGDGHAVEDAHVQLVDPLTGASIGSAYTNSQGVFEFDNVPFGAYDVVADLGASETRQRINVADMDARILLRLPHVSSDVKRTDNATVSVAEYQVPKKAHKAYERALSSLARSDEAAADKYIDEALSIYPTYSDALTLRGVRDLDRKKPDAAIADLDNAVKADRSNARAYLVLASAFNMTHRYDEALRILDRALPLAPNAWQGYFETAKAHIGKAEFAVALHWLDRAEQVAPKNFAALYLVKVNTLLAMNNYAGAAAELKTFLTNAPQDPQATQARAMLAQMKPYVTH